MLWLTSCTWALRQDWGGLVTVFIPPLFTHMTSYRTRRHFVPSVRSKKRPQCDSRNQSNMPRLRRSPKTEIEGFAQTSHINPRGRPRVHSARLPQTHGSRPCRPTRTLPHQLCQRDPCHTLTMANVNDNCVPKPGCHKGNRFSR